MRDQHPLPTSNNTLFTFPVLCRGYEHIQYTSPANMNLRKAPASSMQKTYDECYLTCSTAIYFEGQVRYIFNL